MPEGIALAWILFAVYIVGTFYLAWLGHKKTKNFEDFAVGKRDMGPGIAGLTLGACLASTATFVINPGFVYKYGLSALVALSVPLFLGIFAGLALLGPGFRKHGAKALTLPRWVGDRFGSPGLQAWFAAMNLLNVFYIVLIVKGSALVMVNVMGVSYLVAVAIVVLVVFSYVFFGGTYAHAYTNTAQGAIMLVVALIIAGYVAQALLGEPADGMRSLADITKTDPHYMSLFNPGSPLFQGPIEVLIAPFILGFAIVSQPHLLIKSLYLKESKQLTPFMLVGGGSFIIFSLVLTVGFSARMQLGDGLALDAAAAKWLGEAMPDRLGAVVGVAILAAAMSTLDGLLVAVSSIVGCDVVTHPAMRKTFGWNTEAKVQKASLQAGRVTILLLGGLAWLLCINPPKLVGIFGQLGVFGLLAGSVPTLVYGIWQKAPPRAEVMFVTSFMGMAIHFGLYFGEVSANPTVTSAAGIVVALILPWLASLDEARAAARPSGDLPQSSKQLLATV